MIRIGIIGFDTSHCLEFTKRINQKDISSNQWVEGGEVVLGFPGGPTSFASKEIINKRTSQIKDLGVSVVKSPDLMIGEIDAVMLEVQEGNLHYSLAKPFIEAGLPVFIDKPFTCNLFQAKRLAELARANRSPIFSSSSLRYAEEVESAKLREDIGRFLSVDVYSPAYRNPRNPGLFNYGIHGIEILYALMGRGCKSLVDVRKDSIDKVFSRWKDGRVSTYTGVCNSEVAYGFTIFGEKKTVTYTVDIEKIYRELLRRIMYMFETRIQPLSVEETIEIIAFIEATSRSASLNGSEEKLSI